MEWNWFLNLFEKILLGAIGGIVALYFARKRFLSERWWDKKYDLYLETFDTLRRLENSLAILVAAIYERKKSKLNDEVITAAQEHETALSDLISLQDKHMLLTPTLTKNRIMVLYATLAPFHPKMILDAYDKNEEDRKEIFDLFKGNKRLISGALGETIFEARRDLMIDNKIPRKRPKGSILGMTTLELRKEVKKYMKEMKKNKNT